MELPYDSSGKMISSGKNLPEVTEHTVADVVSEWSNVPIGKIETEETDRLLILESELTQRVKGQARAVRSVSRAVRRARSGLRDQSRPIASFMFCGPTVSFMFFSLADNGLDGVPISPFSSSLHPRTTNHSENDRASVKQNCARPSQKHTLARRRYVEISSLLDERIYIPLVPRRFMVIHFSHLIPSLPPFHINQISPALSTKIHMENSRT